MLGWEYPPHITGGLATACAGLCEGLAHAGAEVTFVVPRAFGDEDQRFARVLGCNDIEVEQEVVEEELVAVERSVPGGAFEGARVAEHRAAPRASFVRPLERALAPSSYATPAEYARWLASITEKRDATPEEAEFVEELRAELVTLAPRTERVLERVERRRRAKRTLHFSGFYGPDLFAEVARYALCVAELAARESFDIVHAHDWMTYPAGAVAARALGKPLVAHMHACEYDRSGEHPDERIRAIEQSGFDAAARIVCVSHYTAGVLRRRYRVDESKLRVVHNAVTRKEQAERLDGAKLVREPIVLFLGRVTFQKGPDYFLEAAQRVVAVEPRVKFVMVGSGDMLPRMIERAARMGLARHVHFTGFLKGDDVERIYSMADIYVMPSVSEPFGISPLEALALDVPVIVSRQSGVSEVLRNALKVDFWDVQEIANKILALLRRPALREHLVDSGREELRAMSWDERARTLRDVYAEVLR